MLLLSRIFCYQWFQVPWAPERPHLSTGLTRNMLVLANRLRRHCFLSSRRRRPISHFFTAVGRLASPQRSTPRRSFKPTLGFEHWNVRWGGYIPAWQQSILVACLRTLLPSHPGPRSWDSSEFCIQCHIGHISVIFVAVLRFAEIKIQSNLWNDHGFYSRRS
jgi:hypothetical protein